MVTRLFTGALEERIAHPAHNPIMWLRYSKDQSNEGQEADGS